MGIQNERLALLEHHAQRIQRRLNMISRRNDSNKMLIFVLSIGGIFVSSTALSLFHFYGLLIVVAVGGAIYWIIRRDKKLPGSHLRYQSWWRLMQHQIARVQLNWEALPPVPPRDEEEQDHPFDNDLDISGSRSLHRLLNTGVSSEGTLLLRDWLLNRDLDAVSIQQRQKVVHELIPLTRFRDKFLINSLFATRFTTGPVDGDRLLDWLDENGETNQPISSLIVALALAFLFYLALILGIAQMISPLYCLIPLGLCAIWHLMKRHEQANLSEDMRYQRTAFGQLKIIFSYLETYPYAPKSLLKAHCAPFFANKDHRPSYLLRKFDRIAALTTFSASGEFWLVLNIFLPIGAYTTYLFDQCKVHLAQALPLWLDCWYELEALNSLANFAYLNPDYTFPEIVADSDGAVASEIFEARALGHPLLAKDQKVTNDFSFTVPDEILFITGSNMAGKSTFLRTLGINLCLAYAGSVVNATSLRLSLFEVYACIRVLDSLSDGYSYFYAEVRRLRGLLNELEQGPPHPIFFLIDEIFKGTNNYERLIGSEAYIRALIDKNCVGAISTHDLELVKLSSTSNSIQNYHFREDIEDGRMVFDYILHPGPSPTRNALRIMEMEGLPVKWADTNLHSKG